MKTSFGFASVLGMSILLTVLAACSPSQRSAFQIAPGGPAIFSNRPQIATHTLLLIKLQQKPLLADLQIVDGKKTIDPKRVEAVTAEQEDLLKKLADLSSDIKVVYRYRMVLNGVAVIAPLDLVEKLRLLANIAYIENSGSFARPTLPRAAQFAESVKNDFALRNSVKFIGGDEAHARGVRGQGIRLGVIDTGIDYTHAMLGGAGTEEAYKSIDPNQPTPAFPNAKVVGGTDLVGTDYDSASGNFMNRLPKPDGNPLDEAGHGTHVAGTIAGRGDGVNSYDGVAPDATLYAIKVFGKEGSTGDATVIAGLEYAADPTQSADISKQLDAVNLSLGGGYGEAHVLYSEAIRNLSRAGTLVVASAGNSGDSGYIVGSPSVSEEALSVAASIDDMDQNWKFRAVKFSTPSEPELIVEAVEGTISKSLSEIGEVTGPVVYAGLADKDFTDELKTKIKGKVAFIDRGVVAFSEKVRRAFEAGAIGVVIGNNQPGEPLAMGGDGKWDIPAIMIKLELATKLKAEMAKGEVTIQFKTEKSIEKPELIDTITGFSSKGPRSMDALIKPEIAAPGSQVVSAKMGSGNQTVQMSGTSMAAPHMTGVMGLLKQTHPNLSSAELKSLAMGSAKPLVDAEKKPYPISRQGAGRVQIVRALDTVIVTNPQSVSLGEVTIESRKGLSRKIKVKNISSSTLNLKVQFTSTTGLKMTSADAVDLAANEEKELALNFVIDASAFKEVSTELDGMIMLMNGSIEVSHIPVLAIANRISRMNAEKFTVASTSEADSQGARSELVLRNSGVNAGEAYVFNFLGRDTRKEDTTLDDFRSKACDLSQAGYRIIKKSGATVLQFAVKLYEPLTTWDQCEISVLIDADGDGIADQELVGAKQDHLKGLTEKTFASILLDAPKTRALRRAFEEKTIAKPPSKGKDPKTEIIEDYSSAVLGLGAMLAFEHSTIAIVEVDVSELARRPSGELSVRIATSYLEGSAVSPDDFLEKDDKKWTPINLSEVGPSYLEMPEKVSLPANTQQVISMTKGAGLEPLLILYPQNRSVVGGISDDSQSEILKPNFVVP